MAGTRGAYILIAFNYLFKRLPRDPVDQSKTFSEAIKLKKYTYITYNTRANEKLNFNFHFNMILS